MKSSKKNAGLALVEFALVLPVLLLMLLGIIDFGVIMYDQAVITNASREGARAGIVLKKPKLTDAQIRTVALDYCQTQLVSLGVNPAPVVTVTQSDPAVFSTPLTVTVTVTYSYSGLLLGGVIKALTGHLALKATSVMNNE
jgi:Flp pilus assembly protein TadG